MPRVARVAAGALATLGALEPEGRGSGLNRKGTSEDEAGARDAAEDLNLREPSESALRRAGGLNLNGGVRVGGLRPQVGVSRTLSHRPGQ